MSEHVMVLAGLVMEDQGAANCRHPWGMGDQGAATCRHPWGMEDQDAATCRHPWGMEDQGAATCRHPWGIEGRGKEGDQCTFLHDGLAYGRALLDPFQRILRIDSNDSLAVRVAYKTTR